MVFLVQLFRVPVLRVQTEGSGVFLIPQKRPECRAEGQIYRVSIRCDRDLIIALVCRPSQNQRLIFHIRKMINYPAVCSGSECNQIFPIEKVWIVMNYARYPCRAALPDGKHNWHRLSESADNLHFQAYNTATYLLTQPEMSFCAVPAVKIPVSRSIDQLGLILRDCLHIFGYLRTFPFS